MKDKEFPGVMYIYICDTDEDTGEPLYAATTDLSVIGHGESVAIYYCEDVQTCKVSHRLEH